MANLEEQLKDELLVKGMQLADLLWLYGSLPTSNSDVAEVSGRKQSKALSQHPLRVRAKMLADLIATHILQMSEAEAISEVVTTQMAGGYIRWVAHANGLHLWEPTVSRLVQSWMWMRDSLAQRGYDKLYQAALALQEPYMGSTVVDLLSTFLDALQKTDNSEEFRQHLRNMADLFGLKVLHPSCGSSSQTSDCIQKLSVENRSEGRIGADNQSPGKTWAGRFNCPKKNQ
eukprot:s2737_g11.t1